MNEKARRGRGDQWGALTGRHANGRPAPDVPDRFTLPLGEISQQPDIFQPRYGTQPQHVEALQRAAKSDELEPITVWWDGKGWTCIDGHHRLEAYERAGKAESIPVRKFIGSPTEALMEAVRSNSRDKLPMTEPEKRKAAWTTVTLAPEVSKAETVRVTGAGEGTVAKMRRYRNALAEAGYDPASLDWLTAQRLVNEKTSREEAIDWEQLADQQSKQLAEELRKVFGRITKSRIPVIAMALEVAYPKLPEHLLEHWKEEYGEDEE